MAGLLDSFNIERPTPDLIARGKLSRIDEHAQAVFAILPAFNRTHEFGPMPFYNANASVGDSVLVAFDEQGSPWVVSWAGQLTASPDMATQAELDAHTALTTTAHGGIVASSDSRLTNARTPTAHASTHASAGSDPITISESQVTSLVSDLAAKAPLLSPTLTGTPAAPTAAVDTNTTQIATTAFVLAQASSSGDGTPAMNGAAARGTSTHFARADHVHPTDTSRAPLASPTLTGTPAAPTAAGGTNTTQIATTAFVQGELAAKAPLASPALTGNPTAPTPATGDNDTSIATTAFVQAALPIIKAGSAVAAGGETSLSVNVPAGYKSIVIVYYARDRIAGGATALAIRFNNNAGASYYDAEFDWTGAVIAANTIGVATSGRFGRCPGSTASSGSFATGYGLVTGYDNGANAKSWVAFSGGLESAAVIAEGDSGCWYNSSPISSVQLLSSASGFETGTRLDVYCLA
jgi:hypothetical protein